MKTWRQIIIAGFLSYSVLSSCSKTGQNSNEKSKIVVLAEITAGDSAIIPVSESAPLGNNQAISFEKITTASVTITDNAGNARRLHWNNATDFSNNAATIYTDPVVFKPDQPYSLQINQPGFETVNATTHIPQSFSVQNVTTADGSRNGNDVLEFNFTIKDNASEKNYYIFEAVKQLVTVHNYFFWQGIKYDYDSPGGQNVYEQASSQQNIDIFKDTVPTNKYIRLNLYTGDTKTDNEDFGGLDKSFHRIFLTDSLFNGSTYTSSFDVDKTHFEAILPEEKGRVLIRIKSVSKELFDYLSMYEKYRAEFGILPPSNLLSPKGNIRNGLGVFGGSYKNEWLYYYDEL